MKAKGIVLALAALLCFLTAVSRMEDGRRAAGKRQLEDALRRTAVSCYAAEGFYPPDVEYMRKYYALQYDEDDFVVHYELFASNLMPEITVVEKHDE